MLRSIAVSRLALAVSLASAGCSSGRQLALPARPTTTIQPTATVPPITYATTTTTSTSLPVEPVRWQACGSLQCGAVSAPLDYAHPTGPTIEIAVARHPATKPRSRIGSLIINPGGPGDSGVDDLPTELRVLTQGLLALFDIVSFDPRGVGRSDPVTCGESGSPTAGPSGALPDPVPQDAAEQQALVAGARAYAQACLQTSGSLLARVGTVDAARDLDRIRAAVGDNRLTFIGHSYGTLLGATYADLFPERVRAMVLDGAIDPALTLSGIVTAQAAGFEHSLTAFSSWCRSSPGCGWRPVGGPDEQAVLNLLAQVRLHPLPVGGRRLGPGEVYLGLLGSLYAEGYWPALGHALGAASAGNGRTLLALSDAYQHHGSSNAGDAYSAVTCLDHPTPADLSAYPATAASAATGAPVFGPLFTWGEVQCAVWSVPPTRSPHSIRAGGAPPIVVVGTTGDPATPYGWALSLASELSSGVLLTRVGIDHVAYYYSACVRAIDERYLLGGWSPVSGTRCTP